MRYVDGFVIPIPKRNLAAYRAMAKKASHVWKDLGALEYYECVGDQLEVMMGTTPFTRLAKLKSNETVVFSWIVYKSRAHRDRVNAQVMKDPRIAKMMKGKPPFDVKRMAYGGFKVLVQA